jgi:hypothetical protein
MREDIRERLLNLQRHTAELRSLLRTVATRQPPITDTEATDPTGVVRVMVAPDGLPRSIRVSAGWQRHLPPAELGAAVVTGYRDAVVAATRGWGEAFDPGVWRRPGNGSPRADGSPPETPPEPTGYGNPRDPLDLTEEVLRTLSASRTREAAALTYHGTGADRAVVLTVAPGELRSCSVNARWADAQSADGVNAAFAEALRAAREAIDTELARRRTEAQRRNELAGEALATLAAMLDNLPRPGKEH